MRFDLVLANLRAQVGETTVANILALATSTGSAAEFETELRKFEGPSGFMVFAEINHSGWISSYGMRRRLVPWTFGNPLIAITMMRHDLTVGVFAPIELQVAESDDGSTSSVIYIKTSRQIECAYLGGTVVRRISAGPCLGQMPAD